MVWVGCTPVSYDSTAATANCMLENPLSSPVRHVLWNFHRQLLQVHLANTPTATHAIDPAAEGAAARIGEDSKQRPQADFNENLYPLISFSMDACGFIKSLDVYSPSTDFPSLSQI